MVRRDKDGVMIFKDFENLVRIERMHLAKNPQDHQYTDWENTEFLTERVKYLEGDNQYINDLMFADIGPAALTDVEKLMDVLKHEREGQDIYPSYPELISAQQALISDRISYHKLLKEFNEMKVKYNRLVKLADGLKAVMDESYKLD